MLNLNFQNGQAPALNARNMNAIVESINTLGYAVGGPNVASTVSEMTDTSKVYVYTGSETGYTAGNWYYYNGSAWVSGGVYQAAAVETDTTLTMPGVAADAKATGDAVSDLESASIKYLGVLGEDEITPDNITDTGFYLSPQTYTQTYCGINQRAIFMNLGSPSTPNYVQAFFLDGGKTFMRHGNSGAFSDGEYDILKYRGTLSDTVTPDNITDTGFYLSPQTYTQTYCGIAQRAIFMNLGSPSTPNYVQAFFLVRGKTFMRGGNSGAFIDGEGDILKYRGALSDTVTPDNITDIGFYLSPASYTQTYCGILQNAVFMNLGSPSTVNYVQAFFLSGGKTFMRGGNSGAFSAGENDILKHKGALSDTVTPDSITDIGFYLSPQTYTQTYCGISLRSVFINWGNGTSSYVQTFILSNGRVFSRSGNSGPFRERVDYSGKVFYESSSTQTGTANDAVAGMLKFYIPYGADDHLRVYFIKAHRDNYTGNGSPAYHNEDLFRLSGAIRGKITNNQFDAAEWVMTTGAWEAAYYKNNRGNAVGTFHGWEKYSKCIIFVDAVKLCEFTPGNDTPPNIDLTPANKIEIFEWSEVYQLPDEGDTTETKMIDVFRRYVINKDGVFIEQRNKWAISGTHGAYLGMANVSKAYVNKVVCNYDYVEYDISNGNLTPISTSENAKSGVTFAKEYSDNRPISVAVQTDKECSFHVDNTSNSDASKLYFRFIKDTDAGESWNNKAWYSLPNSLDI